MNLNHKRDCVRGHRKLWNEIIRRLKDGVTNNIISIKRESKEFLFPNVYIMASCFGCHWSCKNGEYNCDHCLFKLKKKNPNNCLDGLWKKIENSNSQKERIRLAIKIRDFPVKG
jgi:hypothetical protein